MLRRPGKAEQTELDVAIAEAADAVEPIAAQGADAAMARFNARDRPRETAEVGWESAAIASPSQPTSGTGS